MSQASPPNGTQPPPPADLHEFDVNFFRPKTEHSRSDMRMIIWMVIIWAVAVFGFQFLLCVLNKPTPETNHATFQSVWPRIQDGTASAGDQQSFARVTLDILGKNVALKPEHRKVLQETLTLTVARLLSDPQKAAFEAALSDESKRAEAAALGLTALGLESTGFDKLRSDLIPSSLALVTTTTISPEMESIVDLYCVHNQNALTDFRFLGFPFHYWYTAQFLLILFVGLCLVYALVTDKLNRKYNFADE